MVGADKYRVIPNYNITCQTCGKDCEVYQEVEISRGEWEMWCYCAACDIETFHAAEEATND